MAEHFVSPSTGIDLDATNTTKEFQLGTVVCGTDSSGSYAAEYMYVTSATAVTQYAACKIDDTYTIAEVTNTTAAATIPTLVGVPQIAMDGSSTALYGWVVISGSGSIEAATTVVADVKVYTTATAGRTDDTASSGILLQGLSFTTTSTANVAPFHATQRIVANAQS
jgi:hypothetical protein